MRSLSFPARGRIYVRVTLLVLLGCTAPGIRTAWAAEELAKGIQDNSFFVEEAYNQEAGVVQHIFLGAGTVDQFRGSDDRTLEFSFTQEWPLFSQAHQLSYTIAYGFLDSGDTTENGIGDLDLSYRYQLLFESGHVPAVAPRVSILLPTGNDERGLGEGEIGYELNLPVSKVLSNRWTGHLNAGAIWYPEVAGESLLSYSLGGSLIYAVTSDFNLMLEAVGSWDEEPLDERGTDREFSAFVSPGLRYAFNLPRDVQIVAGLAAPIGLTGSAPDYGVLVYFSIEHGFVRAAERPAAGK